MENRNNNANAGLWFLLGVAVGAAGAYYLQSEDGKRLRRQVAEQANELGTQVNEYGRTVSSKATDYGRNLGDKARQGTQNLSDTLNTAIEQGKSYVDDLGGTVKERLNTAAGAADKVESSFQRGMNKAKRSLQSKADKIDKIVESGKA